MIMTNIDRMAMVMDIVNNPEKHRVNRAEKMEHTIDKMVVNMNKQQDMIDKYNAAGDEKYSEKTSADYGYGNKNGRKTGD